MNKPLQQRIVCAALRNDRGDIICSVRHFDGLTHMQIRRHTRKRAWKVSEQGFVDNHGRFLTREQALAVATEAGQIIRRCGGDETRLYSENLY